MYASEGPRDRAFLTETKLAVRNAPFVDGGWLRAIDMVARATRSRGANLVCLGGAVPSLNMIAGFDQAEVDRYFSDPAMWGRSNWRVGVTTQPFEVQHDEHYRGYRKRHGSGDYCAASHQLDMPYGCQTIFSQNVAGFIGLAVMRGKRDGAADPSMVGRFQHLIVDLGRALRAEMAMAGQGTKLRFDALEQSSAPLVLLNKHGWVCGMSDAGLEHLEGGVPLVLRGARISAASEIDDRQLQRLIDRFSHASHRGSGPARLLLQPREGTLWRLHLVPLPAGELALGFDASLAIRIERLFN
jgi:hypothetical protein